MNSKQILGNAASPERLGQFKARGGEETNMCCVSGCLAGAASQNVEEVGRGGGMGKRRGVEKQENTQRLHNDVEKREQLGKKL